MSENSETYLLHFSRAQVDREIAGYVQKTVQNPNIINLLSQRTMKTCKYTRDAETNEIMAYFLKKI